MRTQINYYNCNDKFAQTFLANIVLFFQKKINSIPKIFGVGAHKTGTTSLAEALEILGVKTSHWNDYLSIREDLKRNKKKLRILKKVDALVDLPVPNVYPMLDKSYPNSKFILTTRNPESWVKSVEKHLQITQEEFARGGMNYIWEEAAFYGQKNFDAAQALQRLKAHNKEVRSYFAHRPNDLLEMDIIAGDGWEKLCAFLGKDVPELPFPMANQTKHRE